MKDKPIEKGSQRVIQQSPFRVPENRSKRGKFISIFRISLVKDKRIAFEKCQLINSQQSQPLIKKLIESQGQHPQIHLPLKHLNMSQNLKIY